MTQEYRTALKDFMCAIYPSMLSADALTIAPSRLDRLIDEAHRLTNAYFAALPPIIHPNTDKTLSIEEVHSCCSFAYDDDGNDRTYLNWERLIVISEQNKNT